MSDALEKAKALVDFDGPRIVTVGLLAGGEILTGKRRDNGLWTSPGGHVDEGETLFGAATREVEEEAGIKLDPDDLELVTAEKITSHRTGKEFVVFGFVARVSKERATAKNDPDKEISEWKWVPLSMDSEELLPANRHAKNDSILEHLGFKPEPKGKTQMSKKSLGNQSITERREALEKERSGPPPESEPAPKADPSKPEADPDAKEGAQPPPVPAPGGLPAEEPEPVVPEPVQKTQEEMALSPEAFLENGTGVQPNSKEHMPQFGVDKSNEAPLPDTKAEQTDPNQGQTEGQAERPTKGNQ